MAATDQAAMGEILKPVKKIDKAVEAHGQKIASLEKKEIGQGSKGGGGQANRQMTQLQGG